MENEKISPALWLYYNLPQTLQDKSNQILQNNLIIEVLIKFHGNLEENLTGLDVGLEVLSDGTGIAFLPLEQLPAFSRLPQVDYIEAPSRLWYGLEESRREVCLTPLQTFGNQKYGSSNVVFPALSGEKENLYGEGVLIAILDSGISYVHPDFRRADGSTRIAALWDQTISSESLNEAGNEFYYAPPAGFLLGTEFSSEMIDIALAQSTIVERMAIVPSVDSSGHGTHVAGIACGNGRASGGVYRGVAPEADLLVVKLGDVQGISFPRTTRLLEAVEYAIRFATERQQPLVINISFGNSEGPHTGQEFVSSYIDSCATRWKTAICVGMGNEGNTARHREGYLVSRGREEVAFAISAQRGSFYMQFWKNYEDDYEIVVISPDRERFTMKNNENRILYYAFSDCWLAVNYSAPTPFQGLQQIFMEWFPKTEYLESGIWQLEIQSGEIINGRYDIWMPAGTAFPAQTRFLEPSVNTTLTMPSAASRVISVGAYDGQTGQTAPFSGRGYTRDGQQKPDLIAPGVDIRSAAPENSYSVRSGTSMATPFVSGGAALLLEWGIIKGNDPFLYGEKLKSYLRKGAREVTGEPVPNNRSGYGVLCLSDSIP